MKNLLSNNWFIGIASGIISYIVIVCITKFLNEENINKANNEILDILKPYVIDIGLPEIDIVLSLIEAISRKYKIQPSKMYPIRILCDELIKEITESIYITSKKKNEYNQQLIQYKKEAEKIEIISNLEEIVKDDFKDRFIMQILIIILIAFLTVGALIFMEKYQIKKVKEMILLIFFLILVSVFNYSKIIKRT